jgi:hypothetical protein
MQNKRFIYIAILLFTICSFTDSKDKNIKISNKLYSLSVPSNWDPFIIGNSDGYIPGERDLRLYHLYYLGWHTPIKSKDDIPNIINLSIESYRSKDRPSISIQEIDEIETSRVVGLIDKTYISQNDSQKRFIITNQSQEPDGSTAKYYSVYALYKSKNIVHCVKINSRENQYILPETQKIINDILNSFSVNKEDT